MAFRFRSSKYDRLVSEPGPSVKPYKAPFAFSLMSMSTT